MANRKVSETYDEYVEERMCLRKRVYETDLEAISAAIETSAKHGCACRYYKCYYGDHYHITTHC